MMIFLLFLSSSYLSFNKVGILIVSSFAFHHHSPHHRHRHHHRHSSSSYTFLKESSSSSSSSNESPPPHPQKQQNIGKFQSGFYNGPLVLIGYSSNNKWNEIKRLAKSLCPQDEFIVTIDITKHPSSSSSIMNMKENENVMIYIIDYSNYYQHQQHNNNNEEEEENRIMMMEWAKYVYQELGYLCLYVNVHPSNIDTTTDDIDTITSRKNQLESSIFIPYTDYEITILNEGQNNNNNDNDDLWEGIVWEAQRLLSRATLPPPPIPGKNPNNYSYESVDNNPFLTMGRDTFFLCPISPNIEEAIPHMEVMCRDVDAMEYRADLMMDYCSNDGDGDGDYDRFTLMHSLHRLRQLCRPHAIRAPALPANHPWRMTTTTTTISTTTDEEEEEEEEEVVVTVVEDALPFVFTIRTANQAGTWPDDTNEDIKAMFKLLSNALRFGIEILDVESSWDPNHIHHLLSNAIGHNKPYTTQILGSHHELSNVNLSLEESIQLFQQCTLSGRAHGAKVVLTIDDPTLDSSALLASEMAQSIARSNNDDNNNDDNNDTTTTTTTVIPHVALVLDEIGQYSRIINRIFTPVSHEALYPSVAAPGQLTATELMTSRLLLNLIPRRKYAILGHNIAYSVSPAMHGAGFSATRLPYSYDLIDMEDVNEFVTKSDFWFDDNFDGLSITIPHKQSIIPYLDTLTNAAKEIGAVNTIVVQRTIENDNDENENEEENGKEVLVQKRILIGENTDWLGIYNPIKRRLGSQILRNNNNNNNGENNNNNNNNNKKEDVALILGAGGTARAAAYAVKQLGLECWYWNRTPEKANILALAFGGNVLSSLDNNNENDDKLLKELKEKKNVRIIISTLPNAANFQLPQWLLLQQKQKQQQKQQNKIIVLDVNYKPYWTSLLRQAKKEHEKAFDIIHGSEMLWEQGVRQFELWTQRKAPYAIMKGVVLANCLPKKKTTEEETAEEETEEETEKKKKEEAEKKKKEEAEKKKEK